MATIIFHPQKNKKTEAMFRIRKSTTFRKDAGLQEQVFYPQIRKSFLWIKYWEDISEYGDNTLSTYPIGFQTIEQAQRYIKSARSYIDSELADTNQFIDVE